MQTRTSEAGEQDLGQERETYCSEALPPPCECFPRISSSREPAGPVPLQEGSICLAPGSRTVRKSPTDPWVGLSQGGALELRPLFLPYQLESG